MAKSTSTSTSKSKTSKKRQRKSPSLAQPDLLPHKKKPKKPNKTHKPKKPKKITNNSPSTPTPTTTTTTTTTSSSFTFRTRTSRKSSTRSLSKKVLSLSGVDASIAPPLEPILTVFPQGYNLSRLDKIAAFRHANARRSHERLVRACTEKITLTGHNGGSHAADKHCKYLIFQLHSNGDAVLVNRAVVNQDPFALRQSLANAETETHNDSALDRLQADQDLTFMEKRNRLIQAFGSRKSRKAVKTALDAKVSSQHLVASGALDKLFQQSADAASARADTAHDAPDKALAGKRRLLPPFNVDAEKAADIYPLEGLLPVKLRRAKSVKMEVVRMLKASRKKGSMGMEEESDGARMSTYVAFAAKRAAGLSEKKKAKQRVRLCVMAQQLMRFMRCRNVIHADAKSSDASRLGILPEAFEHLADVFGTKLMDQEGSVVISKQARDRVHLHLLAVCLHIERFEVGLEALEKISADTKKPLPKLVELFQELGCTAVRQGKKLVAICLKTPLTFPKPRNKAKPPQRR